LPSAPAENNFVFRFAATGSFSNRGDNSGAAFCKSTAGTRNGCRVTTAFVSRSTGKKSLAESKNLAMPARAR